MLGSMREIRKASLELEVCVDESIERTKKAGYYPKTFILMRKRHETIPAMTRLVQSGEIQSGFKKLKQLGLAQEWSIEAIILKYPHEFTAPAVECARWRLEHIDDA